MKIILVVVSSIFITATYVFAGGITIDRQGGPNYKPVKNDMIRMVSDEVTIKDGRKVSGLSVYENLTDRPITFKIAFPLQKIQDDGFSGGEQQKLKAWVNNTQVQFDLCSIDIDQTNAILIADDKRRPALDMACWDIAFAAKEKKQIRTEFIVGWAYDIRYFPEEEFFFILRSGTLWSGKIAKADYYLQLPMDVAQTLKKTYLKYGLDIKPDGYSFKDNQIEWHFIDWTPKQNIEVQVVEEIPSDDKSFEMIASYYKNKQYDGNKRIYDARDIGNKYIGGDYVPIKHEKMERLNAKALRNEIYARHGRIFTTPEMRRIFDAAPWYRPRSDFKESELNDIEMKNVEFIFEFERMKSWK